MGRWGSVTVRTRTRGLAVGDTFWSCGGLHVRKLGDDKSCGVCS